MLAPGASAERRTEIAKRAAKTRWSDVPVVFAGCRSPLCIGSIKIDCYVLDDERAL